MAKVFIGVDPQQAVGDDRGGRRQGNGPGDRPVRHGQGRVRRDATARRVYPERVWAVEGSNGAGRPLAQRLLADGEPVVDVPAKLSARAREPTPVTTARPTPTTRTPWRWSRCAPPARPKAILATVRPREVAGKVRRRLAAEQIADLVAVEKKIKTLTKELKVMVLASGSTLMELPGVGPVVAARTLADTGDVARFTDRNRFASWTGTAPDRSLLRADRPAPALPRR